MSTVLHASCDAAVAHAATEAASPVRPTLILATTIVASSLAFIDGSVVNVGLPVIGRSLSADLATLPWIVNAYLLPLSSLLLLGGAAGDRYGRRRLLVGGTGLFAVASLLCALANDLPTLSAGRFLQGIGAAILMPNSLAILGNTFSGPAKGRAIGIWAATGAAMGAVGPVVGGWLIDAVSWRMIFLLNLPLAAATVALALFSVPRDSDAGGEALDWTGGLFATFGLGALTWGLTVGASESGWNRMAIGAIGVAIVVLAAFLVIERRRGERAMMPLLLFASAPFIGLTLLTLFLYGALGVLVVLVPYVLIEAAGYSSTAAGAALLPVPLVIALASPNLGRLAASIGARVPLAAGSGMVGLGFVCLGLAGNPASYAFGIFPGLLLVAFGLAGTVAPLTTAVLESVDGRHAGSASGFNSAIARTGGLVATAFLAAILSARSGVLVAAFRTAMIVCSMSCFLAAVTAFVLIPARPAARE